MDQAAAKSTGTVYNIRVPSVELVPGIPRHQSPVTRHLQVLHGNTWIFGMRDDLRFTPGHDSKREASSS